VDTLVVTGNPGTRTKINAYLSHRGHTVHQATDGQTGLEQATSRIYDALVLDATTPRLDGQNLIRQLRDVARSDLPIIVLSDSGSLSEKLEYFRSGADDYLPKPFEVEELEARLSVLVRRCGNTASRVMTVGDLSFDTATLRVERAGKPIRLYPTTFTLLRVLMRETHRVVRRTELEKAVWGDDVPTSDSLRTHIACLRSAIDKPFNQSLLHTIHGIGYRLSNPRSA